MFLSRCTQVSITCERIRRMTVSTELDTNSPVVQRALKIREKFYAVTDVKPDILRNGITRQDWNKLELVPACGVHLICSARTQNKQ